MGDIVGTCVLRGVPSTGVEVDPLNNLQFSNSKGYKHCQGQVLDAQQVSDIADGLEKVQTFSSLVWIVLSCGCGSLIQVTPCPEWLSGGLLPHPHWVHRERVCGSRGGGAVSEDETKKSKPGLQLS